MQNDDNLEIATTVHLEKFGEGAIRIRLESSNGEALDEVFAGEAASRLGDEFSAFCQLLARTAARFRSVH
jgi:hypothetical protein